MAAKRRDVLCAGVAIGIVVNLFGQRSLITTSVAGRAIRPITPMRRTTIAAINAHVMRTMTEATPMACVVGR
jgi:hypothetical protein